MKIRIKNELSFNTIEEKFLVIDSEGIRVETHYLRDYNFKPYFNKETNDYCLRCNRYTDYSTKVLVNF